jgi:hypothetical protein
MNRLKHLLPQIHTANEQLANNDPDTYNMEHVDSDDEQVIEMVPLLLVSNSVGSRGRRVRRARRPAHKTRLVQLEHSPY